MTIKTTLTDEETEIVLEAYKQAPMGRDSLYWWIHENLKDKYGDKLKGITQKAVAQWLLKQEAHQVNLKPNRSDTAVQSVSFNATKSGYTQIDLFEIPKTPKGTKDKGMSYVLTAVDVYTKNLWAKAIPNKSSVTIQDAMIYLMNHDSELDKLTVIQCDNGNDFSQFRELFAQTGVKVINSIPHQPKTNGVVERMNSTIKQMIARWLMVNNKTSWVDALEPVVKAINTTKSFVHKQFPNKIEDKDPKIIAHLNKKNQQLYGNRSDFTLKVGDLVRLRLVQSQSKPKAPFWSKQVYEITRAVEPKFKPYLAMYYSIKKVGEATNQKGLWNSGTCRRHWRTIS